MEMGIQHRVPATQGNQKPAIFRHGLIPGLFQGMDGLGKIQFPAIIGRGGTAITATVAAGPGQFQLHETALFGSNASQEELLLYPLFKIRIPNDIRHLSVYLLSGTEDAPDHGNRHGPGPKPLPTEGAQSSHEKEQRNPIGQPPGNQFQLVIGEFCIGSQVGKQ